MLRAKRRRGFTLVELLIVIVIIGILAGSMMLTMGKARSKARATRIVSNMRTIQKAAMMYYCDTGGDWFPDSATKASVGSYKDKDAGAYLLPYLDGELADKIEVSSLSDNKQYFVWYNDDTDGDKKFYVICQVYDGFEDYDTRKALQEMCSAPPFYNGDGKGHPFVANEPQNPGHTGNTQLTLLVVDQTFASN